MLSRASARAAALGSAKQGIGKLQVDSTALFVCDIQKVFAPLIHEFPSLVANTNTLINATRDMGMRPAVITEQVPRTFGNTVDEILSVAGSACPVIEKTDFSMVSESVIEAAGGAALRSVVLTGIEAHVCVQQTALDLMEQGIDVHVVVDAVSSQRQTDRDGALHRMAQSGAYLTTVESVMFSLMGGATHPSFRSVLKHIKGHAATPGSLGMPNGGR